MRIFNKEIFTLALLGLGLNLPINTIAEEKTRIQTAVDVVSNLCLSGTEYGIEADVQGNITIKNFKPKGGGSLSVNVRESMGATGLQEELRIIGDKNVRECTQKHIGRILDAIFNETPSMVDNGAQSHDSIGSAKFLGYVPDRINTINMVEGDSPKYYRFAVKEPSRLKFMIADFSQRIYMDVLTPKEKSIGLYDTFDGGRDYISGKLFVPGEYYLKVTCGAGTATAFKLTVEGLKI
ncbi:MAG: hypothetical protein P8176_14565 [Gammaproteobacteria bacterium]